MLEYLLENHIYFFINLLPTELEVLTILNKTTRSYFTNDIWKKWYLDLSQQNYVPKLDKYHKSVSLRNVLNHVTSIDIAINTKNKYLYQYLAHMNIKKSK